MPRLSMQIGSRECAERLQEGGVPVGARPRVAVDQDERRAVAAEPAPGERRVAPGEAASLLRPSAHSSIADPDGAADHAWGASSSSSDLGWTDEARRDRRGPPVRGSGATRARASSGAFAGSGSELVLFVLVTVLLPCCSSSARRRPRLWLRSRKPWMAVGWSRCCGGSCSARCGAARPSIWVSPAARSAAGRCAGAVGLRAADPLGPQPPRRDQVLFGLGFEVEGLELAALGTRC